MEGNKKIIGRGTRLCNPLRRSATIALSEPYPGGGALLVREAALVLALVEAVRAILARILLAARHAVVETRQVLWVLLGTVELVLGRGPQRIALAREPELGRAVAARDRRGRRCAGEGGGRKCR